MYALILIDGDLADSYATLNLFEDKALWDWLDAPVYFGDDATVDIALPGDYTVDGRRTVNVTVGSTQNDKAHHLHALLDSVPVEVDEDSLDEGLDQDEWDEAWDRAWRKAADDLCSARGVTDTYVGLRY